MGFTQEMNWFMNSSRIFLSCVGSFSQRQNYGSSASANGRESRAPTHPLKTLHNYVFFPSEFFQLLAHSKSIFELGYGQVTTTRKNHALT